MADWDRRFMELAAFYARWSKDPSTQVGAVITRGKQQVSQGYNGFPAGVADLPERLANRVYANRMGNGPEDSGEGWRYRGRGLIQITGRAMYEQCGRGLAQPLLEQPDLLLQPELAALSAGWYWVANGCHKPAEAGDMRGVTRIVNGGLNGLEERLEYLARARLVLQQRQAVRA